MNQKEGLVFIRSDFKNQLIICYIKKPEMKDYIRMKLWGVSFLKPLFREELIKILKNAEPEEYFDLLLYCYNKYSDMHPEILAEVFSVYKNELSGHGSAKD